MNRRTLAALALAGLLGQMAHASYTFIPPSSDLYDLDHTKAYAWGIKLNLTPSESIAGAKLTIKNIRNWQIEPNVLNVTLLNTPPSYSGSAAGNASNYVVTKNDAQTGTIYWEGTTGNPPVEKYGGWGHMFHWTDADGLATGNTLVYDFGANTLQIYNAAGTTLLNTVAGGATSLSEFKSFLSDGLVGIGFDPDCHYYNDGVKLEITTYTLTNSVPGPVAALPFALGFLTRVRRRRNS